MLTYQDFERGGVACIPRIISEHMSGELYSTAKTADEYDRQRNTTIYNYVHTLFSVTGQALVDYTATNSRIASNFFHRLNMQRCTYLLGNGVSFADDEGGKTKAALGSRFDEDLARCAYKGLIHGVSFGFWDVDRLYNFPVTEFAPLWDEYTGALRAGVRFWRLAADKPVSVELYEEDGVTTFRGKDFGALTVYQEKHGYKQIVRSNRADGERVVGYDNYGTLPIVPIWGSELKQSTLIGMQQAIDSFDLIRSGFANDLSDVSQVYWLLENYGGMNDDALKKFRDRLKFQHIASVDTSQGGSVKAYTQEIPFEARQAYLTAIRKGIYEDFGALDVMNISAAAKTATEIDASYQPLDEEADHFELQVIPFVQQVCKLAGLGDVAPVFKRNRISNQKEQTDMVASMLEIIDQKTALSKLPWISVDEIDTILENTDYEEGRRFRDVDEGPDETITAEDAIQAAERVTKKALNGAQTNSLINVISQLASGKISEGTAANIIATAIGVTKDEALAIIRGE